MKSFSTIWSETTTWGRGGGGGGWMGVNENGEMGCFFCKKNKSD